MDSRFQRPRLHVEPAHPLEVGLSVCRRVAVRLSVLRSVDFSRATTYSVGVFRGWEHRVDHPVHGALGYFAVGPRVSVATVDHRGIQGMSVTAVGRMASFGHGGPSGFDLGVGAATGGGTTLGLIEASAMVSFYYVDIGYTVRAPMGAVRPDWLSKHSVGFRVVIPARRWKHRVSPPPE